MKDSEIEHGVQLAERGYVVFPALRTRERGPGCKVPPGGFLWRDAGARSAEEARRLAARYPAADGWAVDCGASGLVVVDLDPGHDPELWRGAEARDATPRGEHLLYAEPRYAAVGNGDYRRHGMTGVDVKGLGGYVIAYGPFPPRETLPVCPGWLVEKMRAARGLENVDLDAAGVTPGAAGEMAGRADPFSGPARSFTKAEAGRYVAAALDRLTSATPGSRNNTLNEVAMTIGHFVPAFWAEDLVTEQLATRAAGIGLAYGEARATIRSGLAAGMREPYDRIDVAADDTEDHTGVDAEEGDGSGEASTWSPQDLTAILDGTFEPEVPSLFPRDDGVSLLYRGRVHSFHGESESGKSMVAQAECARIVRDTQDVAVYVDFESDAGTVVGRLLAMGARADDIKARFIYIRPDVKPAASSRDAAAYEALMGISCAIVIVDGVTEGMGVFGVQSGRNEDEVSSWVRWFPRRLAQSTGAAVVLIDHVVKNPDVRGRFAVGSQAKMNGLDGSAFTIEVRKALGRGMRGGVSMRVAKDRPGGVRPNCGEFRASDRTQEAAYVVIDSTNVERIQIEVRPPLQDDEQVRIDMERISKHIEENPGCTTRTFASGKFHDRGVHAANRLAALGYVAIHVQGNAHHHESLRPYRFDDQAISEDDLEVVD